MTPLGWLIFIGLMFVAIFAVANWTLLTASATLNFLLFTVEGPFALILFSAIMLFGVLFAVYALTLRTSALLETRRHMKDLEAQRAVAETAEASRLAALTTQMQQEFAAVRAAIDDVEQRFATRMDDTANAVFASVGEVDDKLDRLAERLPAP